MKIVGIIPARYHSTRFPGKALADLNGRPLICHALAAASASGVLDEVAAATDSALIAAACREHGFSAIMTAESHQNPTSRAREAALQREADLCVMIGGDEPLVTPGDIRLVVERSLAALPAATASGTAPDGAADAPALPFFVMNAAGVMRDPAEVLDPANIKIVCSDAGEMIYASRSPVPYPKGTLDVSYRKFVSIGVYTRAALDFFAATPPGSLELAEECDLLRFAEHRRTVLFTEIPTRTLSVDTPKDLERVKRGLTEEFKQKNVI